MADDEFRYEARQAEVRRRAGGGARPLPRVRTAPAEDRRSRAGRRRCLRGFRWTRGVPLGRRRGATSPAACRNYAADWRDGLNTKCLASIAVLVLRLHGAHRHLRRHHGRQNRRANRRCRDGGRHGHRRIASTRILSGQPLDDPRRHRPAAGVHRHRSTSSAWCSISTSCRRSPGPGSGPGGLVVLLAAARRELPDAVTSQGSPTRAFSALISTDLHLRGDQQPHRGGLYRPGRASSRQATALLTLLLALGTFYVATTLTQFRRSSFLLPWMSASSWRTSALRLRSWR